MTIGGSPLHMTREHNGVPMKGKNFIHLILFLLTQVTQA